MEAKEFITKDMFDKTIWGNAILYWEITKQNYDFKQATDASRLVIHFRSTTDITGTLMASGANCDHLRGWFEKYIKASVVAR